MSPHRSLPERLEIALEEIFGAERVPLLVAVSGGPDSGALAHALSSLERYAVRLGYVNHRLRSDTEQHEERAAVEKLASMIGAPLETHELEPGTIESSARTAEAGIEAGARAERYRFLTDRALEWNAVIVTAHHRDDLVETVLMQLLSGRSIAGNEIGIARDGTLRSATGGTVRVVRPALSLPRNELREWAVEHALPFVIDSSNEDTRYRRNLVRSAIVPVLREYYPRADEAIDRLARDLEELKDAVAEMVPDDVEGGAINRALYDSLPVAARSIAIRRAVQAVSGRVRIETRALEELIRSPERIEPGYEVRVGDVVVTVSDEEIRASRVVRALETGYLWVIRRATILEIGDGEVSAKEVSSARPRSAAVSIGPVESPLVVRPIHPGDRVLRGERIWSVQDVVRELGAGREQRYPPAILEDRRGILGLAWCGGVVPIRDKTEVVEAVEPGPGFSPPLYLECKDDS